MDPIFAEDACILLNDEQARRFARKSPVLRVHHIGITSRYSDRIRELLKLIPFGVALRGVVHELGVNVQYLEGQNVYLELVEPVQEDSVVSKHQSQFPGCPLHHIAFEVQDLDEAIAYFSAKGYGRLNQVPYPGPEPHQAAVFLSPPHDGRTADRIDCDG